MAELLLHMNNYSITKAITAYQTYPNITIFVCIVINITVYSKKQKQKKPIQLYSY